MSDLLQFQKDFESQIDISKGPFELFQHLTEIAFFMKNRDFKLVRANQHFYRRLGLESELDLIGKDDFELFPKPLAKKFRKDDEQVMESGEGMLGTVELFLNRQGVPDWYITNKLPVFDHQAQCIGVMGTVQKLDQARTLATKDELVSKIIQHIVENPGDKVLFSQVAKSFKISHRQLDRRFKDATGLTPQQFLNRKRIEIACKILREERTQLLDIAIDLGYSDQSAFTAQFRQCMGITPAKYRAEFRV